MHLPLSPQLIRPVTQPGAQEVSVGEDHDGGVVGGVKGWGVLAEEQDQVVHQELVVDQPKENYAEETEKLSSDCFHFDLQKSPREY